MLEEFKRSLKRDTDIDSTDPQKFTQLKRSAAYLIIYSSISIMASAGATVKLVSDEPSLGSVDMFRYYYYDIWQESGDPRIQTFPLMAGGPWAVLGIIAAYIYFVKVLGPELMSTRKAFSLKPLIFGYNVVMVLINAFFFCIAAYHTNFGVRTWFCTPVDQTAFDAEWKWKLTVGWLFVMSKFVDLLDTIFFVLRKNFHQVSTLHVMHHALVPINCWLGLKYVPSESAVFMPFINSFIHTVMYSYYALSTFGPWIKPYLWWKKYLTQMQIIQLALVTVHCIYLGMNNNCALPRVLFLLGIPQVLLILYMFCDFFLNSYVKVPPSATTNGSVTTNGSAKLHNSSSTPVTNGKAKSS